MKTFVIRAYIGSFIVPAVSAEAAVEHLGEVGLAPEVVGPLQVSEIRPKMFFVPAHLEDSISLITQKPEQEEMTTSSGMN